jgi:alpha-L-fucosidase
MVKYSLMDQIGQKPKGDLAVKQIFFTKKPQALYAISAGWPGKELVVKNIKVPAQAKVTLLGVDGECKYSVQGQNLTIEVPGLSVDEVPCLYAYAFKITGADLLPEK